MKRGAKKRIVTPPEAAEAFRVTAVHRTREAEVETPALKALGLAHYWEHLLDTGKVGSMPIRLAPKQSICCDQGICAALPAVL